MSCVDPGALTTKLFTIFARQSWTTLLLRWQGPDTLVLTGLAERVWRLCCCFHSCFGLTTTAHSTAHNAALKFDNHLSRTVPLLPLIRVFAGAARLRTCSTRRSF